MSPRLFFAGGVSVEVEEQPRCLSSHTVSVIIALLIVVHVLVQDDS